MAKKVTDEEFSQIQADERQEKLLVALTELIKVLKDKSGQSEVLLAADRTGRAVEKLVNDLKTAAPKDDVVSSERIDKLTAKLTRQLASLQESLSPKPTEWSFEIVRDAFGMMTEVKAKAN